jgi:hypothetical protein
MPFEGVKTAPPPRVNATRPAPKAPEKRASPKAKAREEAANGIGQMIAFGAMVSGNLADAGAIGMHWPNMAHEAAQVAETDATMAGLLDKLLEVGPYGNLIIVSLPFVAQLLVNHKLVKPEAMAGAGVVHPDALEAEVKRDMALKAMEAMRQQQDAEAQMREMAEEMAAQNGNGPE